MKTDHRVAALAALALLTLGNVACGGDDDGGPAAATTTAPPPERIVSMSATATEMLFAIGAGDQVVAVDDQSNHPADAPQTDLSAYEPNLEAIAAYDPDLVVIGARGGDLQAGLEDIGIDVLAARAATSLDDTYDQLRELGTATGHRVEAREVVRTMQRRIEEIAADVPDEVAGLRYYHELDPGYFSATSKTFIGSVYALLGLENIADPADDQGGGYPQLSAEYIVEADPEVIFLADTKCCQQTAATVAARDGWTSIAAVRTGAIIELDDDVASRWGPRIVDFLEVVAGELASVEVAA